jgi:secreted trypsin-like serine protease
MNAARQRRGRRSVQAVLAAVLLVALTITACGGGDSDSSSSSNNNNDGTEQQSAREQADATYSNTATPSALGASLELDSTSSGIVQGAQEGDTGAIISGSPLDIKQAPWTAALVVSTFRNASDGQICGGVLVSPTFVMTAAHCVSKGKSAQGMSIISPAALNVVLGRTDLNSTGGERLNIKRVAVHSLWDTNTITNDYALLELATPSRQTPAVVPTATSTSLWQAGNVARLAGWGCTDMTLESGECPAKTPTLQQAKVEIRSTEQCSTDAQALTLQFDPAVELCGRGPAGAAERGCHGDSGGPLTMQANDKRWFVVGLVSWGEAQCKPNTSEFFALVAGISPDAQWYVAQA